MKVIHTAAAIVSAVASIAAMIPGPWQGPAALIAVGAGILAAVTAPSSKPKAGSAVGSATEITLDPQAGVPYAIGRTLFAGALAAQDTYGAANVILGTVLIWSLGPVQEIEVFRADQATVTFSGGAANGAATSGGFNGFMWLTSQLGACPESSALTPSQGTLPGWGASSKLSGLCAGLLETKFDKNGKVFAGGFPQVGVVLKGVKVYDPRLDSTYPGGSGSCRALDETTYVWSENPALHGITFALGRFQNGEKVMGVGQPVDGLVMHRWVDFANVCDANGWKVGGMISSLDDKWNALKQICQAGMGQPIRLGGLLSCDFQAPRVSLATITKADLAGDLKIPGTKARRTRFNTGVARYRSEDHGWEIVSASPISIATYVTEDRGKRSKEIEYSLIQDLGQASTAIRYDIEQSREIGPITIPVKVNWLGYIPGDCVTVDIDDVETGLSAQPVVIQNRTLEPGTCTITLDVETETAAKHPYALGQTGTAPPTPSLTPVDLSSVAAPGASAWSVAAVTLTGTAGESVPVLHVTGAVDNGRAEAVLFEYRVHGATSWLGPIMAAPNAIVLDIPGVTPGAQYDVAVSYQVRGVKGARRTLATVTAGSGSLGVDGAPGADGAPGVSPVLVTPHPASVTIPLNADGSVKSGGLPFGLTFTAVQGASAASVTAVAVASATGCAATGGTSSATIDSISATEGSVTFTVTAGGGATPVTVAFTTSRDGGSGAVSQTVFATSALTWTSYAGHDGALAINASSTGKLNVNLSGYLQPTIGGELQFDSKIQISTDGGGTWTDVSGSEHTSTLSEETFEPHIQTKAQVNGSGPYALTGLGGATACLLRIADRKHSGSDSSAAGALTLYAEQVA